MLSVEKLDPLHREIFDSFWAEARTGQEKRLCTAGADTAQGLAPECIDWAAMSAISGDHSCSAQQMLDTVLNSDWILAVADVAAQLELDLSHVADVPPAKPKEAEGTVITDIHRQIEDEAARARRINALRASDVRLQRADPEYATRAGSNNAHFLMARPQVDQTASEYLQSTLFGGSEISAVGVWGWYHYSALLKASRLAHETFSPEQRSTITRAMLADEAFALHFLEGIFAAGPVAGTWGDVSQRKGTHDYYNERGLEVSTWSGGSHTVVLMGDAHMRPQDAERAAAAVRFSLEEVLDTVAGRERVPAMTYMPKASIRVESFDVCRNDMLATRPADERPTPEAIELGAQVLGPTPVPGLGHGLGSLPRFRAA